MKVATIVRKEVDISGSLTTLSFKLAAGESLSDYDLEQIGGCIIGAPDIERGLTYVMTTETTLEIGDSITDDFGGEPIISEVHGTAETIEIKNAFGKLVDYRDAFAQKQSGEGED